MNGAFLRIFVFFIIFLSFALGDKETTLELSFTSSPARINPLLATDSASGEIVSWIFNGLVKFDKHGAVVPDLAEKYHFESNTTLIFDLKKGIKWHDGEMMDGEDVLYTYELMKNPKLVTPYKDEFKFVKSVELLGSHRLKVTYTQPYFKALSIWMVGILPKHLWEKEDDPMTSHLNKAPIGTGPYKLEKPFEVNEKIVLRANDHYLPHRPHIDTINYHYIGDPSTQFMTLKAQQLDMGGLDPLQVKRQLDGEFHDYYRLITQPSSDYTYMGFNLRLEKFKNLKVREAIAYALDKQELIDLLFFSYGKKCEGPFMPETSVYPTDYKPKGYDPIRSKELLKELRYTASKPLEFEVVTNTGNDVRINAAIIIQHQLARVGIVMKIRVMEWQAFLNTVVMPHQFEAVLLGWNTSPIPDAVSTWHSDGDKQGGFNFIGYHNKSVDTMIEKAEKTINPEEFARIYREIFKQIADDTPYLFLYIPDSITAINKKIQGLDPTIMGIMHNQIEWKKERIGESSNIEVK